MINAYEVITRPRRQDLTQAIVDNATESIVLIDKDHKVLLFNSVIKGVLRSFFPKELTVGDDYRDFVVEGNMELYLESFEKALKGISICVQKETVNGDVAIWFEYTVNPVYDHQRNLICITLTATDITEKKRLEVERDEVIAHLLQKNRDLLEFSQIVSHNIRGPLATLLGLVDLVDYNLSDDEKHFLFDGIKISSQQLDRVIKDLNQILYIRESLSEEKVEVDLDHILVDIKAVIDKQKNTAVIESDFSAENNLLSIKCYISDIFYNLISNAIKYAKPGMPPTIKIWTQKIDNNIVIYFKDNGIGINVERHKERMFGLYQKFNLNTDGKGFGLFLTKTQIEKLHGSIAVESDLENGTTFKVTLPQ